MTDRAYAYHGVAAQAVLDHFGIAEPKTFDAKQQKAG
jgi:hypothetical protein